MNDEVKAKRVSCPPSLILFSLDVMKVRNVCLSAIAMVALSARADDLEKFGKEMTYFYLTPSRSNYEYLQSEGDRLAGSLKTQGNVALLAAVVIASASQKHHWEI